MRNWRHSREELHSLNEEMLTLNAELNARIEQLSGVRNDIKNLLDSVNVGTLFLDHHLTICRYTLETLKIFP
jgi:two-component system CheB/CheR fusion protein